MERGSDARSWHEGFTRYRVVSAVFNIRPEYYERVRTVLEPLDLPTERWAHMYSNSSYSTPLLDGFVIELSNCTFPGGGLMDGLRVVGYSAFRVLCALLGLSPPARRFDKEDRVPSAPELLQALAKQQESDQSSLIERARLGVGIDDRTDLALLVWKLYGDEFLPRESWPSLDEALPGGGEWGQQSFSMSDRKGFERASIGCEEAVAWRAHDVTPENAAPLKAQGMTPASIEPWQELGCDPEDIVELAEYGLDVVRPWLIAGVDPGTVGYCLEWAGYSLDQILAYTRLGCSAWLATSFIEGGLDPIDFKAFSARQWRTTGITYMVMAGLRAPEARKWAATGLSPFSIWTLVMGGHTIAEVKALANAGKTTSQIEALLGDWSAESLEKQFPDSPGARRSREEEDELGALGD